MAGLSDAASELESIARHLRRAGETELVRELTRAMRDAVGPVPDEIRAGLRPHLPDRYAADPRRGRAARRQRPHQRAQPGRVRHRAGHGREGPEAAPPRRGPAHPPRLRQPGALARPQHVEPGWFTGPAEAATPRVRAGIERALEDIAAKAASKGA